MGGGLDGGEDGNPALGQRGEKSGGFFVNYRQAQGGACRGAQGFLVPDADGSGKGEDGGGAEGLGGADEGAEVAGILQARGDNDQRSGSGKGVGKGEAGRLDESGDALRGFGGNGAVEDGRNELDDGNGSGQLQTI